MKQANFQSLFSSLFPSSILKSENHTSPLAFPAVPPNLNAISTVSLFLELNTNSSSCQSVSPLIATDLSTVSDI